MIRESDVSDVHIAPHTLRVAAMFTILTRLKEPKTGDIDLMKKMRLYDGESVEGYNRC